MRLCALRFPRQLKEVSPLSWAVDACTKRHLNCEMMRRNFSLPLYLRAALMFAACALLIPYVPAPARAAQTISGAPQREQLLNGLPIMLAYRPGDPSVLLKLRIESGAVFDLAGKEGEMALLSDLLFPDQSTRAFVTDELGGQFEITTDYDHIDVLLSGRASEFERLADLLRSAVVNMRVNADDVARLRAERIKTARATSATPTTIADRAIAARLFGVHPYARFVVGTPESLARVERNDLLLARDRFITADNARLVMIGGVEPARAMRAFRQFLGAWRKSEALVPATFRQPATPDARTLVVDQPNAMTAEVRLAVRGLARTDRDHVAAAVGAALARARWQSALGPIKPDNLSVRHFARALGGLWQMSAQVRPAEAALTLDAARAIIRALATQQPSAAELEQAKREVAAVLALTKQADVAQANEWLDAESYKTTTADEQRALGELTPADVQRVAVRLFRDAPVATVATGPLAELRESLARTTNGVEVFGASAPKQTPAPTRHP